MNGAGPPLTRIGLSALILTGVGLGVLLALEAFGVVAGPSFDACVTGSVSGPPLQPGPPPLDPPMLHWRGLLLVVCVGGFLGGHLWGHGRSQGQARRHAGVAAHAVHPGGITLQAPRASLQLLLVGLFAFGAVALGYETFAVAGVRANPDLWPITYYVRCAHDVATWQTLIGALVVAILVGHWLGYQPRTRRTG
jgi:hypothetical protein